MLHLLPRHAAEMLSTSAQPGQVNGTVPDSWMKDVNMRLASSVLIPTLVVSILAIHAIAYTLNLVVILAAVEAPQIQLVPDNKPPGSTDSEQMVSREFTITSKIRLTIRHLVSKGGFFARWRGFCAYLAYLVSSSTVNRIVSGIVGHASQFYAIDGMSMVTTLICTCVADLVCALLAMTHTHIVISEPQNKTWLARIPPMRTWKKVALPTLLCSFATQITINLPALILQKLGLTIAGVVVSVLVSLIAIITIYLPTYVALIRIQTSLLPEDTETIVEVDRTFNDRVVPLSLGGSGCLSVADAGKSFSRAARVRFFKVASKVAFIQAAMVFFVGFVLVFEYHMVKKHGGKPSSDTGSGTD